MQFFNFLFIPRKGNRLDLKSKLTKKYQAQHRENKFVLETYKYLVYL
jgi:hypothetical protein